MATITRVITETVEVPDLGQVTRGGRVLIKPVDAHEYGRLLELARGMKRPRWTQADVVTQITARFGGALSRSTYGAWEAGNNLPQLDMHEALIAVLDPPGGRDWFAPAYSPELREALGIHVLPNVPDPWAE